MQQADAEPLGKQGGGAAQALGGDGPAALGARGIGRAGHAVAVAPGAEDALEVAVAGEQVAKDAPGAGDGQQRAVLSLAGDGLQLAAVGRPADVAAVSAKRSPLSWPVHRDGVAAAAVADHRAVADAPRRWSTSGCKRLKGAPMPRKGD